jgi:hypothetical protein
VKHLERAATVVMVIAAAVVAAAVAKQAFFTPRTALVASSGSQPLQDPSQWHEMLSLGRLITDSGSGRKVVVFSDYECPACRAFHTVVREIEREMPGTLEVRLIHMPLDYHRFALPGARLAECAAAQGSFRQVTDALFESQDSLGLLSWQELARRAKAPDPDALVGCASALTDSSRFRGIAEGVRLGQQRGARGTPTVVIDGIQYNGVPSRSDLLRAPSK